MKKILISLSVKEIFILFLPSLQTVILTTSDSFSLEYQHGVREYYLW